MAPGGGYMGPPSGVLFDPSVGLVDPGYMFHQPEGINDLHPDLPNDPLRIGGIRRPNPM